MPGGATSRFDDPDQYQADLGDVAAEFVVTNPGHFDARLTRATLPHLMLLCAQESLARVAYISLLPRYVCVSLSMHPKTGLIRNGIALQPGDIVFHGVGERLYQRTTGASRWGLLILARHFVTVYAGALAGTRLGSFPVGCIVRPSRQDYARLTRLIEQIVHLVETRPVSVGHPEIAHALEQEVIHALVACVEAGETSYDSPARGHSVRIMARFEGVLADNLARPAHLPEICTIVGVSERTLRTFCTEFLGLTPSRYVQLRRLKLVRAAILCADPTTARVGQIARRYGFTELGRFAAAYRSAFGETPSITLRRGRIPRRLEGISDSA